MLSLSFNPIWSFVDLNGNQLDDTYYLFTLANEFPYIYSPIFQDTNEPNPTPWSDPIQFLANGTLPYNLYWDTDVVYRLEIRQGNMQSDPLIYLVENYIPGSNSSPIPGTSNSTENQISNPQFAFVNFNGTPNPTFTSTGDTIEFAPDWKIVTTGSSGSVTITQLAFEGVDGIDSNPSHGISIVSSGWTSIALRQRFNHNGALWAGEAVAVSLVASASNPVDFAATIIYSDGTRNDIIENQFTIGYQTFANAIDIPASSNIDAPDVAYTDFEISWSGSLTVNLTSIQLVGQDDADPLFAYQQVTIERHLDNEFHYYKPLLDFKPIPSYLVGWDFPLNPAQFGSTALGAIGANKSAYVWDQTIVFQSTDSAITPSRSAAGNLVLTVGGTASKTAIIQYAAGNEAKALLLNNLSVNTYLKASAATPITISLWYTANASLPVVTAGTNNSLVTGLDANGYPTVIAGWVEVARITTQKAQFTSATSLDSDTATNGFSGWQALANSVASTATFFAIVVGTGSIAAAGTIEFGSVSLVPGDIPTIPAPQTPDEVLRETSYYFETSYSPANSIGAATEDNALLIKQLALGNGTDVSVYPDFFSFQYRVPKYSSSCTVTLYSTAGTINKVSAIALSTTTSSGQVDATVATFWKTIDTNNKSSWYKPTGPIVNTQLTNSGGASQLLPRGAIEFHYVVDSRLGIV